MNEARTASAFESYEGQGPAALYAFLEQFPKGADLHVHLSGAVYAETLIRDADEDGVCVDSVKLAFAQPPCVNNLVPARKFAGNIDAKIQLLYDKLIDALSMRSFVPYDGWSGHDQFFAVFDRVDALKNHTGEWVDEVAARAAGQNQQYLELMVTPPFSHAAKIGDSIGWNAELEGGNSAAFARFRQQLLDAGLSDEVPADRDEVREAEARRRQLEHCGTLQATAACSVQTRYIYQVLRGFPPEQVFAQTLLGFEAAATDPRIVGINYVQPEDDHTAMANYALQMRQIGYLHSIYPKLHISLHAGEIAPGMVPPEGLRFHIRMAVEVA
ncbi:MAG: adenosine deaminase, partial [Bryobacteraceae bacterium]